MSAEGNKKPIDPAETHRKVGALWNDAAPGWAHWEPELIGSFWPVAQALLRGARIDTGMRVLDVGCGIGDPALSAASAVGPKGSVVGVDLSEAMIDVARDRAKAYQLDHASFRVGAVETLDLPANHFDAVVGRFSIIFFPDVSAGLTCMHDRLRPGGRIAVATWLPPERNRGFALPSAVLREFVDDLPPNDPDAPGPFRLSRDGELHDALQSAGFVDVTVEEVPVYIFARDAKSYWSMVLETSATLRKLYAGLDDTTRIQLRDKIFERVEEFRSGDVLRLPACARVGSGTKNE